MFPSPIPLRRRTFRRYVAITTTSGPYGGRVRPAVALISDMRREVRPHGALAKLAAAQHGIVSQRQLVELGYSDGAVARAVRSGDSTDCIAGCTESVIPPFQGTGGISQPFLPAVREG